LRDVIIDSNTTNKTKAQFHMGIDDKRRLESLPWHIQLEEWEQNGIELLVVRRGDSRHPVIFVERQGVRYAIKETTPRMAEREIASLQEIERRGIPALSPIGTVFVSLPPIALDSTLTRGIKQYINADRGYTVTRLAPRVVPHIILYRLPLTRHTKERMLSAVAVLMIELHEHGVYWGDPSLANALIRIDGKNILALMADAETAELFPHAISDGLREQDLTQFGESLAWQAEDLRQARGLPEDVQVLDDDDYLYFRKRYEVLRRQHRHVAHPQDHVTRYQAYRILQGVNTLGDTLTDMAGQAVQQVTTVLPGWYQRHIYHLLHITIPRAYARRFYNILLEHQKAMSRDEERVVSIDEAAHDWYERYHLPTILLLRRILTSQQDPMQAYFAIMQHKRVMSRRAGHEVPMEDVVLDWSMGQANTGQLGAIDPAKIATWWNKRQPVAKALEPALIEHEELEPLLSTAERPLIHLEHAQLEQVLPDILEKNTRNIQPDTADNES
jgi:Domain of unknown function (DUF4032)